MSATFFTYLDMWKYIFTHPHDQMLSAVLSVKMAGRPRANRFEIVPLNEVMNNAQILQERWRIVTLSPE